jgi:hypothetical protein
MYGVVVQGRFCFAIVAKGIFQHTAKHERKTGACVICNIW